jgi:3-oxoacyl-[acyl-carrier protein] reductase
VGGAALYLASDEACFVNGHPIHADGGQFLNAGVFAPGMKL